MPCVIEFTVGGHAELGCYTPSRYLALDGKLVIIYY